jgi:hypothetical protein
VLAPDIELLAAALAEAVGLGVLNVAQWRRLDRRFRVHRMVHAALGPAAVLLFALAGPTLLLGAGEGRYLMAPAVLSSFGAAIYNAWVLLVEIVR